MMTLKELRKSRYMTLEQVSDAINISVGTLSKIENGKIPLKIYIKNRLEKFYGESFEFEYVDLPTYNEYLLLKEQHNKLQQTYDDLLIDYQNQLKELRAIRNIVDKY